MGLYLLGSAVAKRPYVVEELGLHLYCTEEMCYYIYHNLSMINENFLDERFFQFIGEECQLPDLAERLKGMQKEGKRSADILVAFFKYIKYYSEEEILQFQRKLESYKNVHPLMRRRDKADILLAGHRYQKAIREYKHILEQPRAGGLGEEFYRQTSENLCSALIRMGFWREAYERNIASWNRWKKIETAEKICYIAWLKGWEVPSSIHGSIQFEAGKQFQRFRMQVKQEQFSYIEFTEENKLESLQEYLLTKKEEYRIQSADVI